jgi:hypothetical protein
MSKRSIILTVMALLLVIAAVFSVYMESKPKVDPGPEVEPEVETEIIEPEPDPEPEAELIPDIKENGTKRKNAKT